MKIFRSFATLCLVAGAGLMSFAGTSTQAALIPILQTKLAVAGGYNWVYDAAFSTAARIEPPTGNPDRDTYLTLYDFQGFSGNLSDVTAPANWVPSVNLLGRTPGGVTPALGDSAALFNVTFKYVGTATLIGPGTINGFAIKSVSSQSTLTSFTSNVLKQAPGTLSHRTIVSNQGLIEAPSAIVPLPASSWMGMVLLSALAGVKYFRRGQSA
jgi:hypothetical protein